MDEIIKKATEIVLAQGLSGVIIIALGFMVFRLLKKNDELTEARLTEAKLLLNTVNENTRSMSALTDVVKEAIRGRNV